MQYSEAENSRELLRQFAFRKYIRDLKTTLEPVQIMDQGSCYAMSEYNSEFEGDGPGFGNKPAIINNREGIQSQQIGKRPTKFNNGLQSTP